MVRKITCTWRIDTDIAEAYEDWQAGSRVPKGTGVELALWLLIHLDPADRDELFRHMGSRQPVSIVVGRGPDDIAEDLRRSSGA
jgi:hypothetical protein